MKGTAYEWIQTALWAGFAFFGGSMGYIMRRIEKSEKVIWLRVVVEGAAASFTGILVLFVCQQMQLSLQWTGVAVGVCGWLGASWTIGALEKLLSKKLGIGKNDQTTD